MKSTDYHEGFADCQRDMEKQLAIEKDGLDPNRLIEDLDKLSGWIMGLLENNGSDEINDEGAPMHANYSTPTIAMLAMAFAQARLVRVLAACTFRLNQGDFSEEQFHHEINEALDRLDAEASANL